ncbi:hypothetical protein Misp06_03626 [Microbulbifer sp. NBRC 101763]
MGTRAVRMGCVLALGWYWDEIAYLKWAHAGMCLFYMVLLVCIDTIDFRVGFSIVFNTVSYPYIYFFVRHFRS